MSRELGNQGPYGPLPLASVVRAQSSEAQHSSARSSWSAERVMTAAAALQDAAAPPVASAAEDVVVISDEEVQQPSDQVEQQPLDPNQAWNEMNKATRRKAAAYAGADPGPVLVITLICLRPLHRLMTDFLHLFSERWEKKQKQTAMDPTSTGRSFRVVELYNGVQLGTFFRGVRDRLLQPQAGLPMMAFTRSVQCLMFRILSRSACAAQQLLHDVHRACPFRLFAGLQGEVEDVLNVEECMQCDLTRELLRKFPTADALRSPGAQAVLAALAEHMGHDVLSVERKHASNRRVVVMRSAQTWPLDFAMLSAQWVNRQQGLQRASFLQHAHGPERKKRGRVMKPRKKKLAGGAWRAYIHYRFAHGCRRFSFREALPSLKP